MTSSQQEADELLRDRQERRRRGIAPERRGKINDCEVTIRRVDGVHSTAPQPASDPQALLFAKRLPRYVERDSCNGKLFFE